jgi:hypothetical protein
VTEARRSVDELWSYGNVLRDDGVSSELRSDFLGR